jgi:hypothetical protein
MIVFDLECSGGHAFEGWFGSTAAYERQYKGGMLECPMCGGKTVTRRLSAPRLNLGGSVNARAAGREEARNSGRNDERSSGRNNEHDSGRNNGRDGEHDRKRNDARSRGHDSIGRHTPDDARYDARQSVAMSPDGNAEVHAQLVAAQAAFFQNVRRLLERSDDVGDRFAEEARRIHYKETPERQIHGSATREETIELIDEGIPVLPMPFAVRRKDELN